MRKYQSCSVDAGAWLDAHSGHSVNVRMAVGDDGQILSVSLTSL